jgi:hypothetical protein
MEQKQLAAILADYAHRFGAYNQDPIAWQTEHGSWENFEHQQKARLLAEVGAILTLLQQITAHEAALPTGGDLEYYATVSDALSEIRTFLSQQVAGFS